MISVPGFNTDIKWQNRVYHVQTENLKSAQQVESLIFAGGEILAAKRTSYLDPENPLQPAEIAAFLHHQHQVITSIIKSGFIEELHQRETVKELERLVDISDPVVERDPQKPRPVPKPVPPSEPINLNLIDEVFGKIDPTGGRPWRHVGSTTMEMLAHLEKLEREIPHAPIQLGNQSPAGGSDPSGSTEGNQPKLQINLFGREEFFAGDPGPLKIVITSDENPFPIKNAEVTVRLVGTAFRPMLWKQVTGADGLAVFDFDIPTFSTGTAAFIIDVVAEEGECQQRFAVRKARPQTPVMHELT
ncbi:MAG TPA: hypothetical protein VFC63_14820 [Blastocatellia bacterium]|nr:hypothetical protein [Blastocatellia bacterium]